MQDIDLESKNLFNEKVKFYEAEIAYPVDIKAGFHSG